MKYESFEDVLDEPFFTYHDKMRKLEEQLYGHVLDAIDWDALSCLEQMLTQLVSIKLRMSTELALDVATAVMDRALLRAAGDPCRHTDAGPPFGITEAEAKAVAFDEKCPFCVEQRRNEQRQVTFKRPAINVVDGADDDDGDNDNDNDTNTGADDNDNDNDREVSDNANHDGHDGDDEPCPLCDDLARSWREQHREVLVKAGLWKPEGEPS